MKNTLIKNVCFVFVFILFFASCQKQVSTPALPEEISTAANSQSKHGHLQQTKTFSSDVASKWLGMQLQLMKAAPTAAANVAFSRHYAYTGITLYESVVPGMPSFQSVASQLNGLSGLPQTTPGFGYHWEASANAALASITRKMFPAASDANKAAIDALENTLQQQYSSDASSDIINRSVDFGKAVAQKVFEWASTDGYAAAFAANQNVAFTYPSNVTPGSHLWVPPAAWNIQTAPYWGNLRRIVPGSGNGAQPDAPPAYSTDPSSNFYKMVKEVYDMSPVAGSPEINMALWWRDVPGTTTPGHYVSILKQVLENDKPTLDVAALAYAKAGIMVYDASISTWQTKFTYYLVRPVTYIQTVIGHTTWAPSLVNTPPHPEYPSAHSTLSAANAEALTEVFGDDHAVTDNTFEYMWPGSTRSYSSFNAIAEEAGLSRLYGGIHYRNSIDVGLWQGRKVANNIISTLKFLKE